MVRPLAFLLFAFIAGCGGGTEPAGPPPPSPPPAPSAVSIHAGDQQTAAPGATLPVKPAVRVRTSQNAPVSGVTVTFAVEAGGGTVSAATATTGADGVATAGDWTLGAAEGQNRLAATVAGLPKVVFTATGETAAIAVADQPIAPSGGVIEYDEAGHPLDGLALIIPAGTFPTSTHWKVTLRPTGSIAVPALLQLRGPVIRIETDAGYGSDFVRLRIPIADEPGRFPLAFFRDPDTGVLEGIPLIARDGESITVATRHFRRGSLLAPPAGASLRMAPEDLVVEVIFGTVETGRLLQPINTGFTPGTDDWEFENIGSYLAPGGFCAGQSISMIWYYYTQRQARGSLFGRFDEIADFKYDNAQGIRFASEVQQQVSLGSVTAFMTALEEHGAQADITADSLAYLGGLLSMAVTGRPQLMAIYVTATKEGHAVVAYRSEPGRIYVADPNHPADGTRFISYGNNAFTPYSTSTRADLDPSPFDKIRWISLSAAFDLSKMTGLWNDFLADRAGDATFPAYQLEYFDTIDDTWKALTDDLETRQPSMKIRSVCGTCIASFPTGTPGQQFMVIGTDDGKKTLATDDGAGAELSLKQGENRVAMIMNGWARPAAVDPKGSFLDFKYHTIRSTPFFLSPATTRGKTQIDYSFVARPSGGAPDPAKFVWSFDDGTGEKTVMGDSTITHRFTRGGTFAVTVRMEDGTGKAVAKATGTAMIEGPTPRWQLTEFTLAGTTGTLPTDGLVVTWGAMPDTIAAAPGQATLRVVDPSNAGPKAEFSRVPHPGQPFSSKVGFTLDAAATDNKWNVDAINSSFVSTGDVWSGTLSGVAQLVLQGFGGSSCNAQNRTAAWSTLEATKLGETITGIYTITLVDWDCVGQTMQKVKEGTKTYTFTGTLIP